MSKGLFSIAVRVIVSLASICVGLGAMGVDVQGMLHMHDVSMVVRSFVGICGALSLYEFAMSCCGKNGSCKS